MKTGFTYYEEGCQQHILVDSPEAAWEMAFDMLRTNCGFPDRISAPGAEPVERDEILRRWQSGAAMPQQEMPAQPEEDGGIPPQPSAPVPALPEDKELINAAVDRFPEIMKTRYRQAVQRGERIEDIPRLYYLLKEELAAITNENIQ